MEYKLPLVSSGSAAVFSMICLEYVHCQGQIKASCLYAGNTLLLSVWGGNSCILSLFQILKLPSFILTSFWLSHKAHDQDLHFHADFHFHHSSATQLQIVLVFYFLSEGPVSVSKIVRIFVKPLVRKKISTEFLWSCFITWCLDHCFLRYHASWQTQTDQ